MQKKIEHIHECVVNGDLEELQSALTRRKMALSRDDQERKKDPLDHETNAIHTLLSKCDQRLREPPGFSSRNL